MNLHAASQTEGAEQGPVRPLDGRRAWGTELLSAGAGAVALSLWPAPAQAHVKWSAPYIVGAPPTPIGATLADPWFWIGIALVLVFFVATRAVERSSRREAILTGLDRVTEPLWQRLDDFVRVVIGAFFVAIFAVGRPGAATRLRRRRCAVQPP